MEFVGPCTASVLVGINIGNDEHQRLSGLHGIHRPLHNMCICIVKMLFLDGFHWANIADPFLELIDSQHHKAMSTYEPLISSLRIRNSQWPQAIKLQVANHSIYSVSVAI